MDGKRALAFARERYAYEDGDVQRVKNQQTVLEAVFEKATSPSILKDYSSLLKALQSSFDTNMTTEEITQLIQFQLNGGADWEFSSFVLMGSGGMYMSAEMGQALSVVVPDWRYVETAQKKIQAVLDGKKASSVKDPDEDGDFEWPDYMDGVSPSSSSDEAEEYVDPGYDYSVPAQQDTTYYETPVYDTPVQETPVDSGTVETPTE